MHGLAESKWSKQRSGPQFFSTKVEPPTPPAETVFDNAPASAQEAFSSSRATLREAEERHPSPKLATSAGPQGSQPYPRPVSRSDQGGANTAPTRGSSARPIQESIGASRPSPSPSAAPRAPPKANGGNPWAAFALAADPEGQAQDGRSYVGGRSYIVDKPAATSTARNHPPKPFPPPQNKTPKPQMNTPKPFSQSQNNTNQRPGPTSAGSGWNSASSTPASQQSWPQSPQSQNSTNQRPASGWNSTSSSSANQQSWQQTPRSATRPPAENRWAGRPLATTAMFTDDFFSTAKPRTQTPSTTPSSLATDRQNQVQSQNSHGWTDQGYTNNNFTQNQDFSNNPHSRPGSSSGSKPNPRRDYKQQQDPQQQMYEQEQQEQQEQKQEQEQEQDQEQRQQQQGQQQQQSHRQPQQPLQSLTPQSYQQQPRSGPINGHKKEPSNTWPAEDEGNTTFHRTSVPNNESGRTSRMDAVSDIPDDPLFLQYPIGDGRHVVVAMYVERSAEAAAGRFPAMTRKRQESSWKQKSVDEVAEIFKQALIEEKKDITG